MTIGVVQGILLPFFGTVLGAACVFVMRGTLHGKIECFRDAQSTAVNHTEQQ